MKYVFFLLFCAVGYAITPPEAELETSAIAEGQSPDYYDKPYNLNPVPINPRIPEPANWKEAYKRLCNSIQEIENRLDLLQGRIRTLEDQDDVTEEYSDES